MILKGGILNHFITLPPLADVIYRARTINHQEHMVLSFCLLPFIHLFIKYLQDLLHVCHCTRYEEYKYDHWPQAHGTLRI